MSENSGENKQQPAWPGATSDSAVPQWAAPGGGSQQSGAPAGYPPPPPAPPGGVTPPPAGYRPAPPGGYAPQPNAGANLTYRSWQPGIIPLRPLSFGDFLAVPFKAMRFNRAVVLGGPLVMTLLSTALTVAALWLIFNDPQLNLFSFYSVSTGIEMSTVVVSVLALVTILLADMMASALVAPGVARAVLGERLSLGAAWKLVLPRLGHLLVLYLFTSVALALLIGIVLVWLFIPDNEGLTVALMLVTGFLVLLPGAILVSVISGVARPVLILEKTSAMGALRRTFKLIPGRFWWTVLIFVVTSVLINIATSIFSYAGQFAALMVGAFAGENVWVFGIAFVSIYGLALVLSYTLTYAYLGSVFALIYTDLRMRHEGFDVDLARAAEARQGA